MVILVILVKNCDFVYTKWNVTGYNVDMESGAREQKS